MTVRKLPSAFDDLEPFVSWALAKEQERTSKRLASRMEDIQAFYDCMSPRLEAVMEYLNQFPVDNMPLDAERLFLMSLSLMEVANAVEMSHNPAVINGFDTKRFVPVED